MCNDTVTFPTFIGTLYSNWDLADKEVNNEGLQKNTVIVRGSNTHTHIDALALAGLIQQPVFAF